MKKYFSLAFILAGLFFSTGTAQASVDVLVSEGVAMTADGQHVQMTISDLYIANATQDVTIRIDSIAVVEADPEWSLVPETTDFVNMEADQNKFSMSADGHDLYDGPYVPADGELTPGNVRTISLTGKTGRSSGGVYGRHVCDIIVTISAVGAAEEPENVPDSGPVPGSESAPDAEAVPDEDAVPDAEAGTENAEPDNAPPLPGTEPDTPAVPEISEVPDAAETPETLEVLPEESEESIFNEAADEPSGTDVLEGFFLMTGRSKIIWKQI